MKPSLSAAVLLFLVPVHAYAQGTGIEGLLLPAPPSATTQAPATPVPVGTAPAPIMQPGVVAPPQKTAQELSDEQFQDALKQVVPVTPDQIIDYRTQLDNVNRATVAPLAQGKPVTRTINLTLKPGEQTPVLRLTPGMVSTLTFADITGQPWPVMTVTTGNPSVYVAQSAGEEGKTNMIVLSATAAHIPSNLVVTLINHPVPVIITLDQGYPEVDYRVDMQIAARGPYATMDMVGLSSLQPTNDTNMLAFLDGTPPEGARKLRTSASDVEAWYYGDSTYVRTPGVMYSPAYISTAASVSGTHLYVVKDEPVLVISRDGRVDNVYITR